MEISTKRDGLILRGEVIKPHTTAERTGDSTTNFIEWVNECINQ